MTLKEKKTRRCAECRRGLGSEPLLGGESLACVVEVNRG